MSNSYCIWMFSVSAKWQQKFHSKFRHRTTVNQIVMWPLVVSSICFCRLMKGPWDYAMDVSLPHLYNKTHIQFPSSCACAMFWCFLFLRLHTVTVLTLIAAPLESMNHEECDIQIISGLILLLLIDKLCDYLCCLWLFLYAKSSVLYLRYLFIFLFSRMLLAATMGMCYKVLYYLT